MSSTEMPAAVQAHGAVVISLLWHVRGYVHMCEIVRVCAYGCEQGGGCVCLRACTWGMQASCIIMLIYAPQGLNDLWQLQSCYLMSPLLTQLHCSISLMLEGATKAIMGCSCINVL